MVTNVYNQTIQVGDFVVYAVKHCPATLYIVKDIKQARNWECPAKLVSFSRRHAFNPDTNRYDGLFYIKKYTSSIHYLRSAIRLDVLPHDIGHDMIAEYLRERAAILRGE